MDTHLEIKEGVLLKCTDGLKHVEVPEGVTAIATMAFAECWSLESVSIPATVKTIGSCVFGWCPSLVSITVSTDNPVYDSRGNCNAVIETFTNTLVAGCSATLIPEGVAVIAEDALCACTGMKSIHIPQSVVEIEFEAIRCPALESIIVHPANPVYDSRGGCNAIIETATNELLVGCAATIIPDSVTELGALSFAQVDTMKSISIPDSVKKINSGAFSDCSALESVVIPEGVTEISVDCFSSCTSLKEVTLPDSLTKIDFLSFCHCESLESISIPEGVTEIGKEAFVCCKSLKSIVIPASVKSIGSYAFYKCTSLETLTLLGDPMIGLGVFDGCGAKVVRGK